MRCCAVLLISVLISLYCTSLLYAQQTRTFRDPYGQEKQTEFSGFVSVPEYDGGLEIGRKIWRLDEKGARNELVREYHVLDWLQGNLIAREGVVKPTGLTYREVRAPSGQLLEESRKVGEYDIRIFYTWEGASFKCIRAEAFHGDILVGTAIPVGVKKNDSGFYVQVEETQYDTSGSGEVVYKGVSMYNFGYTKSVYPFERMYESNQGASRPPLELFLRWGAYDSAF